LRSIGTKVTIGADFVALGAALSSRDRGAAELLYVAFDLLELGDGPP
jgi:hypothetical protein